MSSELWRLTEFTSAVGPRQRLGGGALLDTDAEDDRGSEGGAFDDGAPDSKAEYPSGKYPSGAPSSTNIPSTLGGSTLRMTVTLGSSPASTQLLGTGGGTGSLRAKQGESTVPLLKAALAKEAEIDEEKERKAAVAEERRRKREEELEKKKEIAEKKRKAEEEKRRIADEKKKEEEEEKKRIEEERRKKKKSEFRVVQKNVENQFFARGDMWSSFVFYLVLFLAAIIIAVTIYTEWKVIDLAGSAFDQIADFLDSTEWVTCSIFLSAVFFLWALGTFGI